MSVCCHLSNNDKCRFWYLAGWGLLFIFYLESYDKGILAKFFGRWHLSLGAISKTYRIKPARISKRAAWYKVLSEVCLKIVNFRGITNQNKGKSEVKSCCKQDDNPDGKRDLVGYFF